jgi:YVTN family beta-propeller protein
MTFRSAACRQGPALAWLALLLAYCHRADGTEFVEPRLRRPIALQLSADESVLYTANRASGTLSAIDLAHRRVIAELAVGRLLADLKKLPYASGLLVLDEGAHELVLVAGEKGDVQIQQRLSVAPYPVSIAVSRDGRWCVVASLWSHRLSLVHLAKGDGQPARIAAQLDLPFAPRCQLLVNDDRRLIVADAFGGQFAIVDPERLSLLHVRSMPAHNIRGLCLSSDGKHLIIAQQLLNSLAHTVRNDVHWGLVVSNDLRVLQLDNMLAADANLFENARMQPLGRAGDATGDPAGLLVTSRGEKVVSLGGVGEIAFGDPHDLSLQRLEVGRRPTGMTVDRGGRQLYVANTWDDSVSVVDLVGGRVYAEISLGARREPTLVEQGEELFYDASFSHDSWMSCHSCHTDGHTNGLLSDNLSDGSFGAPKRVLSLLGRHNTAPFAWTGSSPTLAHQVRKSIENTMQSDEPPCEEHVMAIAAFVDSLPPPPSRDRSRNAFDERAIGRGSQLFAELGCDGCHAPPTYTSADCYDVGLEDKQGNRRFNPPSLLGVSQRAPLFHDNRAPSLRSVFDRWRHQLPGRLSDQQLQDLVAFLRSL